MRIEEATFVVTDTETTGLKAGEHRLIEVAAVKVQGGVVTDRFAQLINPERSVPRFITEMTGITTALLFRQPTAAEVLPRYRDFLGDGVLVAHNLTFDLRFLAAELDRLALPALDNSTLCTLRLARRLLNGLPSKSLESVAGFLGIPIHGRHRAGGDAEATAQVLLHFLQHLAAQPGLTTLAELLTWQHTRYQEGPHVHKRLHPIRQTLLPALPDRPGVYFMHDRRGKVIYIGKAKSLRNRVRSYFTGIEGHSAHIRQLVEAVHTITWEETGSELAALLRESRLIKQHQPRFNRAALQYRTRPFLRLAVQETFPRLSWRSYLADDGAEYFGPLAGRGQAETVVEIVNRHFHLRECDDATFSRGHRCLWAEMGRCEAPCEDPTAAARYATEVQRVRAFLAGQDATVAEVLEAGMKTAAAALDFEQAARLRDWRETLRRLQDHQPSVATPVLDHNAVLVLPGRDGTVELYLVRFGRLAAMIPLPVPPDASDLAVLQEQLALHFDPCLPRPERYLKQEVDEVRLLLHWMYIYRSRTQYIPWQGQDLLEAILQVVQGPVEEAAVPEAEPM
jgi:DNA polymerase-3 subunit epsilon